MRWVSGLLFFEYDFFQVTVGLSLSSSFLFLSILVASVGLYFLDGLV